MDLQLTDKTCLVQSASKGIGKGLATALATEGARVTISSSNRENLDTAAAEIKAATGATVDTLVLDAGDTAGFQDTLDGFLESCGGVDILVVNSPGPKAIMCEDITPENLEAAIQANLRAAVQSCQSAVPYMKEKKWGRILHLSSTTAREPDEGMVLSNFTRAGVISYAKTLARECGSFGITVNSILTGGAWTDRMLNLSKQDAEARDVPLETVLEEASQLFPTKFIPNPEDFARNFLFLCSPHASFINGVNLPLDGGLMRAI